MFLTSVIATLLAGMTFTGTSSPTVSEVDSSIGLAHITYHLDRRTVNSEDFKIFYTYTDNGNSYNFNIFNFRYNSTSSTYEIGYSAGDLTNIYFNCSLSQSGAYVYSGTVSEWYDDGIYYSISLPNTPFGHDLYLDIYFGLIDSATFSDSTSYSYQDAYNEGLKDGIQQGLEQAEGDYQQGYQDARELYENQDAVVTSIFSGILGIGLIPIEFFMSIFNFEVLGINFAHIVSAILTLMVLVILVRVILGGKKGSE